MVSLFWDLSTFEYQTLTPLVLLKLTITGILYAGLWATLWQGLAVKEVFSLSWGRATATVLLWIVVVGVLHDLAGLLLSLAM